MQLSAHIACRPIFIIISATATAATTAAAAATADVATAADLLLF